MNDWMNGQAFTLILQTNPFPYPMCDLFLIPTEQEFPGKGVDFESWVKEPPKPSFLPNIIYKSEAKPELRFLFCSVYALCPLQLGKVKVNMYSRRQSSAI